MEPDSLTKVRISRERVRFLLCWLAGHVLKRFIYDGVEWTVVHTGLSHSAEGVYRLDVWFSTQGRPPILGRIPKTLEAMTEDELRS